MASTVNALILYSQEKERIDRGQRGLKSADGGGDDDSLLFEEKWCAVQRAVSVPGLQHMARAVHGAAIRISLALFPGRVLPTLFASPQIGFTVTLNCALAEIERRDGCYSASESFLRVPRLCCEAIDVGDAWLGPETFEGNVVGYSSERERGGTVCLPIFCGMVGCLPWGFWLPFRAT